MRELKNAPEPDSLVPDSVVDVLARVHLHQSFEVALGKRFPCVGNVERPVPPVLSVEADMDSTIPAAALMLVVSVLDKFDEEAADGA